MPAIERLSQYLKDHTVLLRWISKNQVTPMVFEATGSYYKGLRQKLGCAKLTIAKVNPRQVRRFAEATRVDALMPARFEAPLELIAQIFDGRWTINVMSGWF